MNITLTLTEEQILEVVNKCPSLRQYAINTLSKAYELNIVNILPNKPVSGMYKGSMNLTIFVFRC